MVVVVFLLSVHWGKMGSYGKLQGIRLTMQITLDFFIIASACI